MKPSTKIPYLLFMLLIVVACQKKEAVEMISIETLPCGQDGDSLTLRASIASVGDLPVLDHGFLISRDAEPDYFSDSVILNPDIPRLGGYSLRILNEFPPDSNMYVFAFAETDYDYIFGNGEPFTGNGKFKARINDFTPKQGTAGAFVKILGEDFGYHQNEVHVWFGNLKAEIFSFSTNSITVKIPYYDYSGDCLLKVITKKDTAISKNPFFLFGPRVVSFSPQTTSDEMELVINGENFSSVPHQNIVTIKDLPAETIESTPAQIKVRFPAQRLLPGRYPLTVEVLGLKTLSSDSLQIDTRWQHYGEIPVGGMEDAVNFVINGQIYVCCGDNENSQAKNRLLQFDPVLNRWNEKARFPKEEFHEVTGFSIDGMGYVLVADNDTWGQHDTLNRLYAYNPATDTWTERSPFTEGNQSGAFAVSWNGKGYYGGLNEATQAANFWSYDPALDHWQQMPSFPGYPRVSFGHCVINDRLYIIGGSHSGYYGDRDVWAFNFNTEQWTRTGSTGFNRPMCFINANHCYVIVHETNYVNNQSFLYLYSYDPENTRIIRDLGIFPGEERYSPGLHTFLNDQLYYGIGSTTEFFKPLSDVWRYNLNPIP